MPSCITIHHTAYGMYALDHVYLLYLTFDGRIQISNNEVMELFIAQIALSSCASTAINILQSLFSALLYADLL